MNPRKYLKEIQSWMADDLILILVGARQVGKTSLLRLLQEDLLANRSVSRDQIHYFSLEDYDVLSRLNENPKNLWSEISPGSEASGKRQYVFLDEIQYLKDPTHFLKYNHDFHKERLKLIVSGSSAFYIDKRFKDSLAGRKKIFHIQSLDFKEFLLFRGADEPLKFLDKQSFPPRTRSVPVSVRDQLEPLHQEYLLFGGYPRVVLAENREKKKELLKELVSSYLKKDMLEADVSKPENFYKLIKLLASQVGSLVNLNELSSSMGVSRVAILNYLNVLERTFYTSLVRPFSRNLRKELTKMPKIFFNDLGIRNSLVNSFDPLDARFDKGPLFENACFIHLAARFGHEEIRYWRTQDGHEIDFVVQEKMSFECKVQLRESKGKNLRDFHERYSQMKHFLLTLRNDQGETRSKVKPCQPLPAYLV